MKSNKIEKEHRSYVKIYWIIWIVWIIFHIAYFLGVLFGIYPFKEQIIISWVVIFFILGGIKWVHYMKLLNYLEKNHYEKWKELNTFPVLGSGFINNIRFGDFLFSEETFDDPVVTKLKKECNKITFLFLVHFLSFPTFAGIYITLALSYILLHSLGFI